jgi:DNA-binding response OmpR family regulator
MALAEEGGQPEVNMSATTAVDTIEGRRIVFVEDDADLRSLYGEVLRAAGFVIVECATLADAFTALERAMPEVVLLDCDLPDGNGLDLARWLRLRSSCAGVRIVVFSGRRTPRDIALALAAGCDTFLEKPCAPSTLVAELAAAAASSHPPVHLTPMPQRAATPRGGLSGD